MLNGLAVLYIFFETALKNYIYHKLLHDNFMSVCSNCWFYNEVVYTLQYWLPQNPLYVCFAISVGYLHVLHLFH